MKCAKVLWGEGLFLRPQHFQQQDAYLETLVGDAMLRAQPYAWGVAALDIDMDALGSGVLSITRIDLVFRDGESYCAPAPDHLPDPVSLDRIAFVDGVAEFSLAIRHMQEHASNCAVAQAPGPATRFTIAPLMVRDRYTDALEAEVSTLAKRGLIKIATDPLDAYANIPIVRLRKTADGSYERDANFIPPSLHIGTSALLLKQLDRLLDALQAKAQALHGLHREPSRSVVEFRSGDVASFWLLHTINSAFAALSHLRQLPRLHPERFFHELLRLAGGLMTFSKTHELGALPRYDHAAPGGAFVSLYELLRDLLETVISTRYFRVMLTESKPAFHSGRIDSGKIDANTSFYLGVRCSQPLNEIIETVPLRMKIGAPDDVEKLVLSALSGVKLAHAPQVPHAIPVRPGTCYFALDPHGPLYERMLKSQTICIYAPASYAELSLELIALTS